MPTRTEKFRALPRGGQIAVVAVLAALGVWLFVGMSDFGDDPGVQACEAFGDLADDVRAGRADATSDETVDRVEAIGEQLQDADGDMVNAGLAATSAAQTARAFPDERDEMMAPAIERVAGVCS